MLSGILSLPRPATEAVDRSIIRFREGSRNAVTDRIKRFQINKLGSYISVREARVDLPPSGVQH